MSQRNKSSEFLKDLFGPATRVNVITSLANPMEQLQQISFNRLYSHCSNFEIKGNLLCRPPKTEEVPITGNVLSHRKKNKKLILIFLIVYTPNLT